MVEAESPVAAHAVLGASPALDSIDAVRGSKLAAFYELTKPGITRMVVLTAAAGYVLAAPGRLDVLDLLSALFGTALAASGSLALNQLTERRIDAQMKRTCGRPLPSGRLSAGAAGLFGILLSVVGLTHLLVFTNALTAAVVLVSLVTYVAVYTPLKRHSWTATLVGAVPGALPVLAGWTAARGTIDIGGFALFAILFLWQMPHFYALAWMYRDDYRQAGFRMLTVDDATGERTVLHTLAFTAMLLGASVLPTLAGVTGILYAAGALLLGGVFFAFAVRFAAQRTDKSAFRLFMSSVIYLPLLLLTMIVDRLFF